jgi:hypothetical protein
MRIVAIRALHQAFFHFVMEGHVELRLGIGVALEAKLGLRNLQQLFFVSAHVNTVATYAAHIVLAVRATLKVGVLSLVATQALRIHLLGGCLCGIEDLCYISATIDVRFARSVAAFAGNAGLAMLLSQPGVWI